MEVCRDIAHVFMSQVDELVMEDMKRDGLIADPVAESVEAGFLPWLQTKTEERVKAGNDAKDFITGILCAVFCCAAYISVQSQAISETVAGKEKASGVVVNALVEQRET